MKWLLVFIEMKPKKNFFWKKVIKMSVSKKLHEKVCMSAKASDIKKYGSGISEIQPSNMYICFNSYRYLFDTFIMVWKFQSNYVRKALVIKNGNASSERISTLLWVLWLNNAFEKLILFNFWAILRIFKMQGS